ncbi:MAG: class I SAM-dependent methyltransferase [Calditrichaeota bacterium]|nr:class I SAM-dependent methyltransferase [Calditrichota bacterium]
MTDTTYFDHVSHQWDAMRRQFYSDKVRETAIAKAQVRAGELAVDMGAGTGFLTEALLAKGVRVIALDASRNMLRVLLQKLGRHPNLWCQQVDGDWLPLASHCVQAVLANMFLHHVESPAGTIRELARVLRPGGRLVITDLDRHEYRFLLEEHHDRWPGFERRDIHQWMIQAGLTRVQVDCVGEECCDTSADGKQEARISIFVAWGEKI